MIIKMWKKIDDYDYSININGEVRNDKTGKIKKNQMNDKGYYSIMLYNNGKCKFFRIHRLLAKYFLPDYQEDMFVDHIDRNPLNNKLDNLRIVNKQQNQCNQTKQKNCSSIYKGVHFDKSRNKWQSYIQMNYKRIHLGRYQTELEAAQKYNEYIEKNNLEFYPKNEI